MFPDSILLFFLNISRFYFPINFWGGVCTANSFHAWLQHCRGLFIVIRYSIFRPWPLRQEGDGKGHHAMSAPLCMVRQVSDSCCIFHSSGLRPAASKGWFWPPKGSQSSQFEGAASFQSLTPLLFIHEE